MSGELIGAYLVFLFAAALPVTYVLVIHRMLTWAEERSLRLSKPETAPQPVEKKSPAKSSPTGMPALQH